ncbi:MULTISPECIES: cupin domain-containing protein [unclassified Amycolatopsis]|uniref:cupin domain-containing protein n=1 Tax=unclassified Amycolatopsis TaxID=2618356 RepID=UPI002E11E07D|nr:MULTISPECIES: cupin domain-containing protein [unclassified Amycolatopsis]WSK80300.1 cupin domain-containing protein [Amycolatopsis sp. NBC_01286]
MTTLLVRHDEAEQLGTTPDTMTLLADVSRTDGHLSTNRASLGRGRDGATPHFHTASAEMFFMLDGELEVLQDDEVVTVRTGDMLFVPPHTTHAFGASSRSGADVLIVFTPGVERFEYFRMIDRIRRGEASPAEILASQERFDNHFVDSETWRAARAA